MEQIFGCQRMKFAEIPQRLNPLLHPPDPIVINHLIRFVAIYVQLFSRGKGKLSSIDFRLMNFRYHI